MDHRQHFIARLRERDMQALAWHWGDAYEFTWARGTYIATRRDNQRSLTSTSVTWLWELVRADYQAKPVPREP